MKSISKTGQTNQNHPSPTDLSFLWFSDDSNAITLHWILWWHRNFWLVLERQCPLQVSGYHKRSKDARFTFNWLQSTTERTSF